ncbi:MAG: hypothetical protein JO023_18835 [Chloroflexi bacterium]|nr:hypothetical protein [Chloroflexota bacterium]
MTGDAAWLQRTIGNQAVGRLLRQTGPASPALQRIVNWGPMVKTKTEQNFAISPGPSGGARQLVSKAGHQPKPVELYTQKYDQTDVTDESPQFVTIWTPNVLFMQKKDMGDMGRKPEDEKYAGLKRLVGVRESTGLAKWQRDALAKIAEFEAWLRQQQEQNISRRAGQAPRLGVLGYNDCAEWARKLQYLIAEEEVKARSLVRPTAETPDVRFDLESSEPVPVVGVGDRMTQTLGEGSGSAHHSATVVARDTSTVVTLEAHVEKNLDAPLFHFYDGGLPAFVDANNDGPRFREKNKMVGSITRYQIPTQLFYESMRATLEYYQAVLEEQPDNFDNQTMALNSFREIVSKPTTTIKSGEGVKEDTCIVS